MSPSRTSVSAKYNAAGHAPEVQLIVAVEIDQRVACGEVLEAAEIPDVSAQTDVLVQIAHDAATGIPTQLIVRGGDAREGPAVDLRAQQADAPRHERLHGGHVPPTDRHANDDVAHEIDDGVVAEVVLRAEEAWAVPEIELTAENAVAHGTGVHAKGGAAVGDITSPIVAHPGCHVAFRVRRGRHGRQSERDGRCEDQSFECTVHCSLPPLL